MIEVSWQLLFLSGVVVYLMGVFTTLEVTEARARARAAKAKENVIGRLR